MHHYSSSKYSRSHMHNKHDVSLSLFLYLSIYLSIYLQLSLHAELQEVGIIPMMLFSDVLPGGGGTAIAEGNQGRLIFHYDLTFTVMSTFYSFLFSPPFYSAIQMT